MSKEQLYFKILQDVADRIRKAVNNYENDKDAERMKTELISILEGRGKQMSEKGSYAHVGLPGLRELFAGGARRTKDDAKQTTKEIQRIFETQADNGYRFVSLEAADVKFLFQQLTEKDATIKELEQQVKKWKSLAESKVTHVQYGDNEHLRKVLKFAGWDIKQKMETKTFKTPSWVLLEALGHVESELVDIDLEGDVVNLTVVEGEEG